MLSKAVSVCSDISRIRVLVLSFKISMSVSNKMHAIQLTTSVTTLLDRTRVNVLQDLLKTLPPRITWNRCVTVRTLVYIV